MDGERKAKRADTKEVLRAIRDLLDMGVVPRSVSVGDVRVEVASYQPRQTGDVSVELPASRHRGHLDRLADRIAARSRAKSAPAGDDN